MPPMSLPSDNQPAKDFPASEPRFQTIPLQPSQIPNTAPEPRVEKPTKIAPLTTYVAATQNRNATRQQKMKLATPKPNNKYPTGSFAQQKPSALRRSRQIKSNIGWENSIRTVSANRRETNALLQVFANAGFVPGPALPNPTQRLPHHVYYSANSVMSK